MPQLAQSPIERISLATDDCKVASKNSTHGNCEAWRHKNCTIFTCLSVARIGPPDLNWITETIT